MKIRFTQTVKTNRQEFKRGDEADIENVEANGYVQTGQAVKLRETAGDDQQEDAPQKPKRQPKPPAAA